MNFLSNLSYSQDVKQAEDRVGASYSVPESGVYPATIKHAYLSTSKNGANAINFEFDLGNGQTHREAMYVTNRNGQNFYEKNGEKHYLPAFIHADAISLFTTGSPLSEQTSSPKIINLYNNEHKKEIPTEVPMLTAFLGKEVKLGIVKELSYKQEYNQTTGQYENTTDTRETASVNYVFSPKDERTVNEVKAQKPDAEFITKWKEKWEGVVKDSTKNAKTTAQTNNSAPKRSGLFG